MDEITISPLTGGKAELIKTIPAAQIIEAYRQSPGISVDKYFENIGEIGIYQCVASGFRFYYPYSIFGDEEFYALLQEQHEGYYAKWYWEHEMAYRHIPRGSKVLEVGCGSGSFMSNLKEKGFDCTGLEINQAAIDVCHANGLVVYKEMIEKHAQSHQATYDVVCSFQVLEHVSAVGSYIASCLECLKPGGKLIFATPNSNPYLYKYDILASMNLPPHHSGLWNRATFKKLTEFFPVEIDTINAEPLFNRRHYLQVLLNHFKLGGVKKVIDKINPRLLNNVLLPLKFVIPGTSMLAVFTKTEPVKRPLPSADSSLYPKTAQQQEATELTPGQH